MEKKKKLSLPVQIFIALVLGIVVGLMFYFTGAAGFTTSYIKPFGDIFVNLLKFIVVPVVLLSMIDGIISMGDMKKVGAVGWKTILYFMVTTAVACVIGLVLATVFNNAGLFPNLSEAAQAAEYEAKGYTVVRLDAVMATPNRVATGGTASLFAYQNTPLIIRLWNFFTGIFEFDNVNYVEEDIADRGLTFTLHDPAYGGEKFSPAILGSGTYHKYLLYFDNRFPFIHQNFLTINLGTSYSVNKGVDAFETMIQPQGNYVRSTTYYPTGVVQNSADDLHSATYLAGSRELNLVYADLYNDDYTNVSLVKDSGSRMYYSFIVSIIASALAYMIGLPLGILMAKRKDTWVDSLGNAYVVLIMAVPGLAYMLMLKAVGNKLGLPTTFSLDNPTWLMYIMPIAASAISAIAGEMRWMRRYMVDQMNSDYVKFARSEGLSEREIFTKHIFKNAAIPIVHGIPGAITGALSGAIISLRRET